MGIVFVLLPISLILSLGGLAAYYWCIKTAQFDDPEGNSRRLLVGEQLSKSRLKEPKEPSTAQEAPGE